MIGWYMFISGGNLGTLILARVLHGLASSGVLVVAPTYMLEISDPATARRLPCYFQFATVAGAAQSFILGPYVSWESYCCACLPLPLFLFFAFFTCPESPHYLLLKDRDAAAERVLKNIRNDLDVDNEIQLIKMNLRKDNMYSWFMQELTDGDETKHFLIAQMAKSGVSLTGMPVILNYIVELISKSVQSIKEAHVVCSLLVLSLLPISLLPFLIPGQLDKCTIMITSCFVCIVTNVFVGQYFSLVDSLKTPPFVGYLLVPLVTYFLFALVGLGYHAELIIAERYGVITRSLGRGLLVGFSSSFSYSAILIFRSVTDLYGTYVNFWIYGIFSLFIGLVSIKINFY